MIENPFCSRKFYGKYDLVSTGHLDLEEGGMIAARTETTGVKKAR